MIKAESIDHTASPERQDPVKKWIRIVLTASLILILGVVLALSASRWYAVYGPCEVSVAKESSTFLTAQLNSYDRVYQVAVNASRDSIDFPVVTMQQILMDTQQIPVPACLQTAKLELINYMDTVIRAFRAWGAGESDRRIRDLLDQSLAHYGNFRAELKAVEDCAPFCFR
jgi:hypothetical protein